MYRVHLYSIHTTYYSAYIIYTIHYSAAQTVTVEAMGDDMSEICLNYASHIFDGSDRARRQVLTHASILTKKYIFILANLYFAFNGCCE